MTVIRTTSQRRRVLLDGTVEVRPHVIVEVPATEFTWLVNCERIGREVAVAAADVNAACRRLLGLREE